MKKQTSHMKPVVLGVASNTTERVAPNILQPLYNTVRYNMVLDITRFKDDPKNV